ncbi:hypothetical protein MKX03_002145, partial [Papaver bracteatum]
MEFFRTKEGHVYFTGQWFYRPCDTVELAKKEATIASSDYYCDMFYKLSYPEFISIPPGYTAEATCDGRDASSGLLSVLIVQQ